MRAPIVLPLLPLLLVLASCGSPAAPPPAAAPTAAPPAAAASGNKVDGAAARALVKDGATLVDVRNPEEYAAGHIEGAVNVPIAEVSAHDFGPKDRPLVLYCMHGRRSAQAGQTLVGRGYTRVYLLGPMSDWGSGGGGASDGGQK